MDNELLKAKKEINSLKDQISKHERLLDEERRDVLNTKQKLTGKNRGALFFLLFFTLIEDSIIGIGSSKTSQEFNQYFHL